MVGGAAPLLSEHLQLQNRIRQLEQPNQQPAPQTSRMSSFLLNQRGQNDQYLGLLHPPLARNPQMQISYHQNESQMHSLHSQNGSPLPEQQLQRQTHHQKQQKGEEQSKKLSKGEHLWHVQEHQPKKPNAEEDHENTETETSTPEHSVEGQPPITDDSTTRKRFTQTTLQDEQLPEEEDGRHHGTLNEESDFSDSTLKQLPPHLQPFAKGTVYNSKEDFEQMLNALTATEKFKTRINRSRCKQDMKSVQYVCCAAGVADGKKAEPGAQQRRRRSMRVDCPFSIVITNPKSLNGSWHVASCTLNHNQKCIRSDEARIAWLKASGNFIIDHLSQEQKDSLIHLLSTRPSLKQVRSFVINCLGSAFEIDSQSILNLVAKIDRDRAKGLIPGLPIHHGRTSLRDIHRYQGGEEAEEEEEDEEVEDKAEESMKDQGVRGGYENEGFAGRVFDPVNMVFTNKKGSVGDRTKAKASLPKSADVLSEFKAVIRFYRSTWDQHAVALMRMVRKLRELAQFQESPTELAQLMLNEQMRDSEASSLFKPMHSNLLSEDQEPEGIQSAETDIGESGSAYRRQDGFIGPSPAPTEISERRNDSINPTPAAAPENVGYVEENLTTVDGIASQTPAILQQASSPTWPTTTAHALHSRLQPLDSVVAMEYYEYITKKRLPDDRGASNEEEVFVEGNIQAKSESFLPVGVPRKSNASHPNQPSSDRKSLPHTEKETFTSCCTTPGENTQDSPGGDAKRARMDNI